MAQKKPQLVYQARGKIMSKNILHKNRNGCALHGALKVIDAVEGFAPIIHSSAGCSIQSKYSENIWAGSNGRNCRGWLESSATAVIEKQVVFGGTARLREQIKNTVKVQAADLYVVITGCAPEIVGDDVPAMVKEAQEQGFPVISVSAPGFKGNVYKGYEWTVRSIVERISQFHLPQQPNQKLVNILGVVPNQDLLWEGNLQELDKTLGLLSIKTSKIFGFGQNIESWRNIPNAGLNLVVSPWGLEIAQLLEKKFGTPYLYFGYLPVGTPDTSRLLTVIGEKLDIPKEVIVQAKLREEKLLAYQVQKLAQTYIQCDLQKELALVGETSNVTGISRFLQNSFGQIVKTVIITDNPNDELRRQIAEDLNTNPNYITETIFASDGKAIDEELLKAKPEVILGSSLEQKVARKLSIPLIRISTPVFDQVFLNRTYIGYTGAINLMQDFTSALLTNRNIPE
jgi:nitrogenase molybdenum-iron protein beta chain